MSLKWLLTNNWLGSNYNNYNMLRITSVHPGAYPNLGVGGPSPSKILILSLALEPPHNNIKEGVRNC